ARSQWSTTTSAIDRPRRKSVSGPVARDSTTLLLNTPPGGTLGRLVASDQSTVAQPARGCSEPQVWPGRPASRSVTTSPRTEFGAMPVGSLALTVIGSWKPGSPNALAAGRFYSPEASKCPRADAGALSGVAEAAEVGDTWAQATATSASAANLAGLIRFLLRSWDVALPVLRATDDDAGSRATKARSRSARRRQGR